MTRDKDANEIIRIKRARIHLGVGALVKHKNRIFKITETLDFNAVLGIDVETGKSQVLPICEAIALEPDDDATRHLDTSEIGDEDWRIAQKRLDIIKPFVDRPRGRKDVEARSHETGVSADSIYRWLNRYEASHDLSSLIPMKRGVRPGSIKLPHAVEEIIRNVIENHYLSRQKPTIQSTVSEIRRRCEFRGLKPPCYNAIRSRIAMIPERERLRRRGEREKAINKFHPVAGKFPGADYPLAVIQIDHTPVDIVLVDDRTRLPIGRPWLTLAIDVYSRMVAGYYLSLDAPSVTSVGLCMANAMLPKDEWLIMHGVDAEWPVWGTPTKAHVDNGPDFQSEDFKRSCAMYGITVEYRPVKTPRYGGHIERLLGTLMKEIHGLPGTTFSSVQEKGEYEPDKNAAMTMEEFEKWLVHFICKVYHERYHHGIGMSPIARWQQGILGHGDRDGMGVPARPADKYTVMLDFMPSFWRTIQRTGVEIEGLRYYSEGLRHWINYVEPGAREKKKFLFRRDPRDVTVVWFLDPDLEGYVKIPVADQSLPQMSLWEYRKVRELMRRRGVKKADPLELAHAYRELWAMVEEAGRKTRKARRMKQRKKDHARKRTPVPEPIETDAVNLTEKNSGASLFGNIDFDAIEPYEEIE